MKLKITSHQRALFDQLRIVAAQAEVMTKLAGEIVQQATERAAMIEAQVRQAKATASELARQIALDAGQAGVLDEQEVQLVKEDGQDYLVLVERLP